MQHDPALNRSAGTFHHGAHHRGLTWAARLWYGVTAFGQCAFILFILNHYGTSIATGHLHRWNDRSIITGHVPGDHAGNTMFAVHVLLAALMTGTGLIQLVPHIRQNRPRLHRISGRVFTVLALLLAVGGLWLTWGRGSYLSVPSALSVSINAVLILIFAGFTIHYARNRKINAHRQWALRLFMVANGVWFFRVMIMAWVLLNQGPRGMNETLSGPADMALSVGSYALPLLALELYFLAQSRTRAGRSPHLVNLIVGLILVLTGLMAIGISGTILFMWW